MSKRKCTDYLNDYIKCFKIQEPCKLYFEWTGIFSISAVLQRKVWLELGSLVIYPNFFIALVGPPAARKGCCLDLMCDYVLDNLNITFLPDAGSIEYVYRQMSNAETTFEYNNGDYLHTSVAGVFQELTSFIQDDDRKLSWLLQFFDCRKIFDYGVLSRDEPQLSNIWVSLIGATQPSTLATSPIGIKESGMISRFILVGAGPIAKKVARPEVDKAILSNLKYDLEQMMCMTGPIKFNKTAYEYYEKYYLSKPIVCPYGRRFDYTWQRRELMIFKLCIVFACMKGTNIVTKDMIIRAINCMDRLEQSYNLVFSDISSTMNELSERVDLISRIKAAGDIDVRLLRASCINTMTQAFFKDTLISLQKAGQVKLVESNGTVIAKYMGEL